MFSKKVLDISMQSWLETRKKSVKLFSMGILIIVFAGIPFGYSAAGEKGGQNLEKRYIIDRFEEDFAILECEDGSVFNMLRSQLPQEAKEGDVVTDKWAIDHSAAERIKNDIMKLLKTVIDAVHM